MNLIWTIVAAIVTFAIGSIFFRILANYGLDPLGSVAALFGRREGSGSLTEGNGGAA